MLPAVVIGAAAASGCSFSAARAEAWLAKQGCSDSSITACPGGATPCSDAAYMARALAAGGAVPGLNPDEADGQKLVWYKHPETNVTYHLDNTAGLTAFLKETGWTEATIGNVPVDSAQGTLVQINAWFGELCYAYGGNKFFCHTPPRNGAAAPQSDHAHCSINTTELDLPVGPGPLATYICAAAPKVAAASSVCMKSCKTNNDCWSGTSTCTNCIINNTIPDAVGKCGTMCKDACNSDSECMIDGCGFCDKSALPVPRCTPAP